MGSDKTYSLSELASSIQVQLNQIYSGSYWISAEILKLNHYTQSGHCYPQLVEKKNGKIVADLKGFILNSRYEVLSRKFLQITQKQLTEGIQIRCRCKVGFHPVYGLSLNILDIDPTHTLGEMTRLRNEAIGKLRSEGIFDRNKSLDLPLLLRRIAVISVETSKGFGDFTQIIDQSAYGKTIRRELFPALLQGDAAVESISKALRSVAFRSENFDAVLIIRGGGGETGLDCYDSYALSKLVCNFPIPVLTGIGHSSNMTIVEQVARKNLTTPSELASFILKGFERFEEKIEAASARLKYIRHTLLEKKKNRLSVFKSILGEKTLSFLKENRSNLLTRASRVAYTTKTNLREKNYDLNKRYIPDLYKRQLLYVNSKAAFLDDSTSRMKELYSDYLLGLKKGLSHQSEKVRILDPIETLKRGYSITYLDGNPLKKASQVKKGDVLKTILSEGEIKSRTE